MALNLMALLSGAPLAMPDFPCAFCAAESASAGDFTTRPDNATTVALGTPACLAHANAVLAQVVDVLDRLRPRTIAEIMEEVRPHE